MTQPEKQETRKKVLAIPESMQNLSAQICRVCEQWEACVIKRVSERFNNVDDFEVKHREECQF